MSGVLQKMGGRGGVDCTQPVEALVLPRGRAALAQPTAHDQKGRQEEQEEQEERAKQGGTDAALARVLREACPMLLEVVPQ